MMNEVKNKRVRATLGAILIVLLCVGCGRKLSEGEVIAKRYEPESTFIMLIPMVISCGKNCTQTMMIPYVVFDDEDYVLTLQGTDEDGEQVTEDWYVSEAVYNQIEAGRIEIYNDIHASRDDTHKKLRKADT